ncbi:hypothetical protein [Microcoleus asticus]|uniref:hypothetical protein n=1 Tax=Microcoleus asticus TaxID=2815231 RepID=UPI001C12EDFD|nr:hypothetical protein [Microcoleus asticus]
MVFLDKRGKLLEMCSKVAVELNHKFPETRLYQIQKLLPELGLTIATVLAEYQRNRFQSG